MITGFDHVNIRTSQLDVLIEWYSEVLGLQSGWRPPSFSFPGAWLYAGDHALIHLVGVDSTTAPTSQVQLEHASFAARGFADFVRSLEKRAERFRVSRLPEAGVVQVNVWDPDDNHLHIDFPIAEADSPD